MKRLFLVFASISIIGAASAQNNFICPSDILRETDLGKPYATLITSPPTTLNVPFSGTRSDNQSFDQPYPLGETTIFWRNTTTNELVCQQKITVEDHEKPVIIYQPFDIHAYNPNTFPEPQFRDNVGASIIGMTSSIDSDINITNVTFIIADAANNTTFCDYRVICDDNPATTTSNNDAIAIAPLPSLQLHTISNTIRLEMLNASAHSELYIWNMNGQTIQKMAIAPNTPIDIDITNYAKGFYMAGVIVPNKDRTVKVVKFMKP